MVQIESKFNTSHNLYFFANEECWIFFTLQNSELPGTYKTGVQWIQNVTPLQSISKQFITHKKRFKTSPITLSVCQLHLVMSYCYWHCQNVFAFYQTIWWLMKILKFTVDAFHVLNCTTNSLHVAQNSTVPNSLFFKPTLLLVFVLVAVTFKSM